MLDQVRSIKTEVIVGYPTILNLASEIRSLLAPYRQFATSFSVQQVNRPEERITLVFESDRYVLDCNWNRLAFVGEGKRDNYDNDNGALRFLFELVEKIQQLDSFTHFNSLTINLWDVLTGGEHVFVNHEKFKQGILAEGYPNLEGELQDIAVKANYNSGGKLKYDVEFGPFVKSDIEGHNLSIFRKRSDQWIRNLTEIAGSGMLLHLHIQQEQNKIDFNSFLRLFKKHRKIVSRFQ